MRGEGARLLDCNGHRFMQDYDPRGELAPRDIVAQSIVTQMEKTEYSNVFLDLSHLDGEQMHRRFPGISSACGEFGIDIANDRIPVRPGAHYMIGGLTVDAEGRTTLPGLWAAGEVTSSGLHGANRLASNSLLESLVFGAHAGEAASQTALQIPDTLHGLTLENPPSDLTGESLDLADIRNSLKSLMWRAAAVRRDGGRLGEAAEKIDNWCRYVLFRQFKNPTGWELQNMLLVARIMIAAAHNREESRGVHLRTDFPDTDDAQWCRHQTFGRDSAESGEL
jgi:L-aspartate oxidase